MDLLLVENLAVSVKGQPVLKGISLKLKPGEIQALIGPNGSGKSSLLFTIAGLPAYKITSGQSFFKGQNLSKLSAFERARQGIFLAWQNPVTVPGLNVEEFLIKISQLDAPGKSDTKTLSEIRQDILRVAKEFKAIDLLNRDLNDGLSGGEKKRLEALQMAVIKPKLALLDEIDSGLDQANLAAVVKLINLLNKKGTSFVVVSHQPKLLKQLKVKKFNFLKNGQSIVDSGDYLAVKK